MKDRLSPKGRSFRAPVAVFLLLLFVYWVITSQAPNERVPLHGQGDEKSTTSLIPTPPPIPVTKLEPSPVPPHVVSFETDLNFEPPLPPKNTEMISVSTYEVSGPSMEFTITLQVDHTGWVGIYSPPPHSPIKTLPIKMMYVGPKTGPVTVTVPNTRKDYNVIYFHDGYWQKIEDATVTLDPVAISDTITNLTPDIPMYPLVLVTGEPNSVALRWVSSFGDQHQHSVKYGTEAGVYTNNASASSVTYTRAQVLGEVCRDSKARRGGLRGWFDPGYFHVAELPRLVPGTRYYYQLGDATLDLWTSEASFMSPPDPLSDKSVHVIVAGDIAVESRDRFIFRSRRVNSTKFYDAIKKETKGDLLLINGDIGYHEGHLFVNEYLESELAPLGRSIPVATSIGNHDIWNGDCGVSYSTRFPMPKTSLARAFYSFSHGPVTYIVSDSERILPHLNSGELHDEQKRFLEKELQRVDRNVTPWVIFVSHRAGLSASLRWNTEVENWMLRTFESVFRYYKVDIVLEAHIHNYQRLQRREGGPQYMVVGNGGHGLFNDDFERPIDPKELLFYNDTELGYCNWTVNRTHLVSEMVSATTPGLVLDTFTLKAKPFRSH